MRRFLTSIDKRGNKIPSQNRTGYLSSPPPRPQSGEEIPVASSIPQSIFLHKTRQYFIDIWRSCVSPFAALRVWLNIMETVLTEKHNTMCHPSLRSGSGSTDAEIQSSRSEPALERSEGVTASGFVILSAAKDLWPAFVQPPCLTWPGGLLENQETISGRGGAPGTSPHLMHEFTQRYK